MGTHRKQMTWAMAKAKRARLLAILTGCAVRGEPCPVLDVLAKQVDVHPRSVKHMLCRLRDERFIRWRMRRRATGSLRIVTILATGQRTATPAVLTARARRTASLQRAAAISDVELEDAKTALRRQGVIVFDATITDGKAGRGLIKVDGRNITPIQVLERAARLAMRP